MRTLVRNLSTARSASPCVRTPPRSPGLLLPPAPACRPAAARRVVHYNIILVPGNGFVDTLICLPSTLRLGTAHTRTQARDRGHCRSCRRTHVVAWRSELQAARLGGQPARWRGRRHAGVRHSCLLPKRYRDSPCFRALQSYNVSDSLAQLIRVEAA